GAITVPNWVGVDKHFQGIAPINGFDAISGQICASADTWWCASFEQTSDTEGVVTTRAESNGSATSCRPGSSVPTPRSSSSTRYLRPRSGGNQGGCTRAWCRSRTRHSSISSSAFRSPRRRTPISGTSSICSVSVRTKSFTSTASTWPITRTTENCSTDRTYTGLSGSQWRYGVGPPDRQLEADPHLRLQRGSDRYHLRVHLP